MSKNICKFFIIIYVLFAATTILAQTDLNTTYVAEDGSYQISHPRNWDIDDSNPDFTILSGIIAGERLEALVFSTNIVNLYAVGADSAVDVAESVANIFEFVEDDAELFSVEGRDSALASVSVQPDAGGDPVPGVAFVIEMDNGDYGMVIVLASLDALEEQREFIVSMVATYNTPADSKTSGTGSGGTPRNLANHAGDWREAVEELQELGLIGTGGSLVFEEDEAFFTGQGSWFTPLGQRSPFTDIVMAGELEFTSGSSSAYEDCSLMARIVDSGEATVYTFLQVGLDNDQDLFLFDTEGDSDEAIYRTMPLNLDLGEPHHILFIAADDTLTVYLDGKLLFDHEEIHEERSGTYGISLVGEDRNSRCEGRNIWVYQAPSFEAGVCEISASNTVNKRSGPGTNFDRAGTMEGGTVLRAVGQGSDNDGFRWWELEDGSWVREDVVNEAGDCASVPESE